MLVDRRITLPSETNAPDALFPNQAFYEGEGAGLSDPLHTFSSPYNPFESETHFFRHSDAWIVVIANRLTCIVDPDLPNGIARAVRQHSKMLEYLEMARELKGDF